MHDISFDKQRKKEVVIIFWIRNLICIIHNKESLYKKKKNPKYLDSIFQVII